MQHSAHQMFDGIPHWKVKLDAAAICLIQGYRYTILLDWWSFCLCCDCLPLKEQVLSYSFQCAHASSGASGVIKVSAMRRCPSLRRCLPRHRCCRALHRARQSCGPWCLSCHHGPHHLYASEMQLNRMEKTCLSLWTLLNGPVLGLERRYRCRGLWAEAYNLNGCGFVPFTWILEILPLSSILVNHIYTSSGKALTHLSRRQRLWLSNCFQ